LDPCRSERKGAKVDEMGQVSKTVQARQLMDDPSKLDQLPATYQALTAGVCDQNGPQHQMGDTS